MRPSGPGPSQTLWRNPQTLFLLGIVLAGSGLVSAPVALVGGLVFGLLVERHPLGSAARTLSKFLLQASVVLLGFGMDLREVLRTGSAGFVYTALSISLTLLLGWGLGRLLHVRPKAAFLITCGTAICGGSAIATLGPVTEAGEEDMAVSLGTIFALNAVALLVFPLIGWKLHLSQTQFGLWSALAIHDTSSVVGAAGRYGTEALMVGTTVKLARALWIVPLALATAAVTHKAARRPQEGDPRIGDSHEQANRRIQIPWFIGLFVLAALLRTTLPLGALLYTKLAGLGRTSLVVVLFLIGTGLTRQTLRRVGVRPMLQGVVLWVVIAGVSLLAITRGWIRL